MLTANSLPNIGLSNTILFGCIVGSRAHNTFLENSDIDIRWVYVQSHTNLFLRGYRPTITLDDEGQVAFELSRFIELLKKGNPVALEMLYSAEECVIYKHPLFDSLLEMKESFLTKMCARTYYGYAVQAFNTARGVKAGKTPDMFASEDKTRRSIYDFCNFISNDGTYTTDKFRAIPVNAMFIDSQLNHMAIAPIADTENLYNLYWDSKYLNSFQGFVKNKYECEDIFRTLRIPDDAACIGIIQFDKAGFKKHVETNKEFMKALERKAAMRKKPFEGIDLKSLAHCIRIADTAIDIAEKHNFSVKVANSEFHRNLKLGRFPIAHILDYAEKRLNTIKVVFGHSTLPETFIDEGRVKKVLAFTRYKLYNEKQAELQHSEC